MSDIDFKPLYREHKPGIRKPNGAESAPQDTRGFLSTYRVPIGAGLMVVGLVFFMLQAFSASNPATPLNLFVTLLVEDHKDLKEDEEPSEPADLIAHYKGAPEQQFVERFVGLTARLELPEGTTKVPIQLSNIQARFVVGEGGEAAEEGAILGNPFYSVVKMSEADAGSLFHGIVGGEGQSAGLYFLGPFPYRDSRDSREVIMEVERHKIDAILPETASAWQGFIIAPVTAEELRPNALLLLPEGGPSIEGYYKSMGILNARLSEANTEFDKEFKLLAVLQPRGYRHPPLMFASALVGEMAFLAGGYLVLFHIFYLVSRKKRRESRRVTNLFIDSCALLVRHSRQYALVVGLILAFWAWGVVAAYLNPGAQKIMIWSFEQQFASGGWPFGTIGWAMRTGNPLILTPLIFVVNFFQGTVLVTTLPSLLPVAGGFIVNAYRGQMLGFTLAPTELFFGQRLVPHLFTILLEMQGYLIAAFVSVLLPLALLKPERFGAENRKQAFVKFFLWQLKILPLVAVILLIAAFYEAIELLVLL
jgi:hypothetical protein